MISLRLFKLPFSTLSYFSMLIIFSCFLILHGLFVIEAHAHDFIVKRNTK